MLLQEVYMACASSSVNATTGGCSNPVWVQQPSLFPSLSATDGGLIAFAILAVWATAYMSRALRTAGG